MPECIVCIPFILCSAEVLGVGIGRPDGESMEVLPARYSSGPDGEVGGADVPVWWGAAAVASSSHSASQRLAALRLKRQRSRSLRVLKRLIKEAPTPTVQNDLKSIAARHG